MSLSSDDYYRLLGIRVDCIPPSHYQVLGLTEFENSQERIRAAVRKLDSRLRAVIQGPDVARAQQILTQIAAAKICLNNESSKRSYDESLVAKQNLQSQALSPTELPEPTATKSVLIPNVEVQDDRRRISTDHDSPVHPERRLAKFWGKHGLGFKVSLIGFLAISVGMFFMIRSNDNVKVSQPKSPKSGQADLDQVDPSRKDIESNQGNLPAETKEGSGNPNSKSAKGNPSTKRTEPKDENTKLDARQRKAASVDVSSLPITNGLAFWLDAADKASIQQDEEGTVYVWTEKLRKDPSVILSTYPKLRTNGSKQTVLQFDGEVGIGFNRFTTFAPKEFTIVFIASGTGILLAKGDPHLQPNSSFSIDNKSKVRFRVASRKFLSMPAMASDQFIPRAIAVSQTGVQLFEPGQESVEFDEKFGLNNEHAISVGMQQSDDLSRAKLNLFQGDVGEILIFDRALSSVEIKKMMNYLDEKWQ